MISSGAAEDFPYFQFGTGAVVLGPELKLRDFLSSAFCVTSQSIAGVFLNKLI